MIDGIDGTDDPWQWPTVLHEKERLEWAIRLISDKPDPADYRSERNFPGGSPEIYSGYWREKQTQFYEKKKDCALRGIAELGFAFGSGLAGDLGGAYEYAAEAGAALAESIISDFAFAWESIKSFSDAEKDRFK